MQKSTEIPVVTVGSSVEKSNPGWWWDSKEPAAMMLQSAKALAEQQVDRAEQALIHLCLYHNQRVDSLYAAGFGHGQGWVTKGTIGHRATYNVVKSVVDTAANEISKDKPALTFLTSGGKWSMRRQAKLLKKFVYGMFTLLKIHHLQRELAIDGGIFDIAALKFDHEGEDITVERVLPTELFIDENDAVYGAPKTLYQRKYVHRQVLKKMYPEHAAAIDGAVNTDPVGMPHSRTKVDMIEVWEAWHLPYSAQVKNDKDKFETKLTGGRRVIAIGQTALVDKAWTKKRFPFYFWRWAARRVGWLGQPLTEEVTGIQLEINDLLKRIQIGHRKQANPRVFFEIGSEVTMEQMTSEVGHEVYYRGTKPSFETPIAFNAETYAHVERLIRFAFEQTGVSQMNAKAEKPAGLDAAVAIREIKNIASERFATKQQLWEEGWIECAEIILDIARDLYSDGVDVAVRTADSDFIESIKWSEVDLPAESITMQIFPTSSLPDDPAGRLQAITELYKAGMISDRTEAMRLLDFPDLEEQLSLNLAAIDEISRVIENIEDHGKYEAPDPLFDLDAALRMSQASYLRGRTGGMPDDRLDMLLRFGEEVDVLRSAAQPAPAPAAPAQGQIDPNTGLPVVTSVSAPVAAPGMPAQAPAMA